MLEVKQEEIDKLMLLAADATPTVAEQENLEAKKSKAMALCKRRFQATIDLYGDGRIDRAEYLRRIERNEREIAAWQARTTEREKPAMELTLCIHTIDTMTRL